jgi:hypothetical protein
LKTKIFALGVFFTVGVSTGFAAPINEMEIQESAVGIMVGNNNNTVYFETKPNESVVIGFESVDWEHTGNTADFYAHLYLTDNLTAIIGNRTFDASSKAYAGAALNLLLPSESTGYTSFIVGSGFSELEVGISNRLTDSSDFNISWRYFKDDGQDDGNGFSAGIITRF